MIGVAVMLTWPFDGLRPTGCRERDEIGGIGHRPHMVEQLQPGGRKHERSSDPIEQRDAEFLLKRSHLPAEGRLRLAECPGGRRQRPFLCGGEERACLIPIESDALPIHAFLYI